MEPCLFCKIVAGEEPAEKVAETANFIVIKNKYPKAPVHLLVIDKMHHEKSKTISGKYNTTISGKFASCSRASYWDDIIATSYFAIQKFGLDKTGYKLVVNGAGYNHFEHEHLHIMGGTKKEPGGET
ncbi:hypothetical protein COT49_03065 [candidate division WWE3 bacterium CG08_land_8_20_14_0_20_40_13]|uniref:HIT domain-containing protein n=1 Tax=candidate division WWE3 bacterium CG08_land_8_20_14_0_20_40_13 TaxID=1975084 RepID=A0A2H0XD40_UNCKA|nr:MAG: hypothetical protein COT49_03065 [candidate division WWE3 bacterium CG08_land_8_20_14_0_20_40_13]